MPLIKGNFVYNPETQEFRERSAGDHNDPQALNELPPPAPFPEMPPALHTERHHPQPVRPLTHERSPFRKNFWIVSSILLLVWFIVMVSQLRETSIPKGEFMSMDVIIINPEGSTIFDVVPQ